MKPFLILQLRKNDAASDGEFEAFLKYGELSLADSIRIRMESETLPEISLDDYSGVIVGGGPWNVSDIPDTKDAAQQSAEAWLDKLLLQIVEKDFPYMGACYGFGALTMSVNGHVSKEQYGESLSAVDIHLTHEGTQDPLLEGFPSAFKAIVGHKEACQTLPENAVWLAKSDTCPIQMYRIGNNVYATQFHPELDGEGVCVRIDVYKNAGYFPPEDAEVLKATMRNEVFTESTKILKRFVQRYKK